MSTDFFDEEELKNLPPLERAKVIKKLKEDMERKLEEEAKSLEEDSLDELKKQDEELDLIIEAEFASRKKREAEEQRLREGDLEKEIKDSPEANVSAEVVEYGPSWKEELKYETGTVNLSGPADLNQYGTNPNVVSKHEGIGDKFYSKNKEPDSNYN